MNEKDLLEPTVRANQLDTLPTDGRPIVFISYAWDDENHKAWVRKLSDDLRKEYGVYTLLDQYNRGGANLINYMTKAIKVSQRVLIIGSPMYAKKIDDNSYNGVVFENQIINAEIYNGYGKDKFIPVLRSGSFKTSFGSLISTNVGYDLSNDEKYDEVIELLAADLWQEPIEEVPMPAPKPVFKKHPRLASIENDPYKGETWLKRLLGAFSFNLMDKYFDSMPLRFNQKILVSFDKWNAEINHTIFKLKDAKLSTLTIDFFNQWKSVLEIGCAHYVRSKNGLDYYFFGLEFDEFVNAEEENAFLKITNEVETFKRKYKEWAEYISSNYHDIDLERTSVCFENSLSK